MPEEGTLVPLPNNQVLDSFTVNGANTVFTVPSTGTYRISYRLSFRSSENITSEIYRNGATLSGSTFAPTSSVPTYFVELLTNLTAGDTLSLRISGQQGDVVLQEGTGASLMVIKVA